MDIMTAAEARVRRIVVLVAALLLPMPAGAADVCFPAAAGVDSSTMQWCCKHLAAAGLGELAGDATYRFICLPTWSAPRIVTIESRPEGRFATGIVLSGSGGYEPGTVAKRTHRRLSASEWRRLEERLEKAGMWEPDQPDDRLVMDGAQWILEGRAGGRYRLHDLQSPDPERSSQYIKVCTYLLELAKIKPSLAELYH